MSQRELAKAAEVSPATVARMEVGQLDPRVGQLQRLLDLVCWSVVVIDLEGRFVVPLEEFQGDLRDGAERRFPAHLDTILDPRRGEWWGDTFGLARPPETFTRDRAAPRPAPSRVAARPLPRALPTATTSMKGIGPVHRACSGPARCVRRGQATSYRSRFMTLSHAATKSWTNFSLASSLA